MTFFARLCVFIVVLVILFFVSPGILGFFAGLHESTKTSDPMAVKQAVRASADMFVVHYMPIFFASITALASIIAFGVRRFALICSIGLGVGGFFIGRMAIAAYQMHNPAQKRATAIYPDLAVRNSPLNQEFVRRYRQYQTTNRHYFEDPEWPTKLAKESKEAVSHR